MSNPRGVSAFIGLSLAQPGTGLSFHLNAVLLSPALFRIFAPFWLQSLIEIND
jgi:hypothetical protein